MNSETLQSNHSQDILLKLDNDRKTSAKYCDITLVVDNHKYPAHKCVLGLLSPFFDKMFSTEMKEKRTGEAVINGVSKVVFESILDFIYTNCIELNMENVFEVIEAAHYMDLPYVKECCTTYVGNEVNAENWLSLLAYGKRYGYDDLIKNVDEYLSAQFNNVVTGSSFAEYDVDELKHLIGLQSKSVDSEEKVYEAVIRWINHNTVERQKFVEDLLSIVKFSEMSLKFLLQVVAKEKLIENSHAILKAVFQAIRNCKSPASEQSAAANQAKIRKYLNLPVNSFVAVDRKSVWKVTEYGLIETMLEHNHTGGSAVKWNSTIVVISGSETKKTEAIDVPDMQFSSFPFPSTECFRYDSAAITAESGHNLYLIGGRNWESSTKICVYSNDTHRFTWHQHDQMNFNRHGHALVLLCDIIYVLGGRNVRHEESAIGFNICTNETKTFHPMLCSRPNSAAVVFDQEIYVIGGNYYEKPSSIVEKFNPFTNNWKFVPELNAARNRPGACVIDNQIVVVGGGSSVIEVYDKKNSNGWTIVGECDELKHTFAIFPC